MAQGYHTIVVRKDGNEYVVTAIDRDMINEVVVNGLGLNGDDAALKLDDGQEVEFEAAGDRLEMSVEQFDEFGENYTEAHITFGVDGDGS